MFILLVTGVIKGVKVAFKTKINNIIRLFDIKLFSILLYIPLGITKITTIGPFIMSYTM